MKYLARKIRKAKWYKNHGVQWLPDGEIQADALVDFSTKANKISVWLVDENKSNLNSIIALLATANTQTISNVDYILIPEIILQQLGIKTKKTEGNSANLLANKDWHIDMDELTARQIFELSCQISEHCQPERINGYDVKDLIQMDLDSGLLNASRMTDELQNKISVF